VKSNAYRGRTKGIPVGPEAELNLSPRAILEGKTTMTTAAGWAPQAIRSGLVVPIATRPVQVLDLLPQSNTQQANVVFMEETTFTNNAAEAAEGAAYAENVEALTERTALVQKIAVFLPVTDEQLADVDQAKAFVNNRLTFSIRQRLDNQV
ncbi:MAG: phage major capsid protein, partial [Chloroflexi bacterium]